MGGIIRAIELGFPQQEIADASYHYQRQLDRGEKIVVGVNKYQGDDASAPLEILRVDNEVERRQAARVRERKQGRAQAAVHERLAAVRAAAQNGTNLMPPIIAAVHAECTVGEISDIFRDVFGVYRDPAWI
jgi:methylmalonyl-CoA mutase N-terminal domain/subunit